jgi:hypothetical protein
MNLGQLLAGQKGMLYKVANQNEKALREEKRVKIAELKKQRELREAKRLPKEWNDARPVQVSK